MLCHVSLNAPPRSTPLRPYRLYYSHWCAAVCRRALLKLFRDVGNALRNPPRQHIQRKVCNTRSAAINGERAVPARVKNGSLIASAVARFMVSG